MGRPRHRVESQVSCPKPPASATAAAASWPWDLDVFRTRVRNQRRTTNPATRLCDAPCMGHLLGYANASRHRPVTTSSRSTLWSAPAAIGRSARPLAAPPPAASSWTSSTPATPWSSRDWIASAAPCGIWSAPSPAWPSAASRFATSRRRPRPPPRRQARLPCLCGPGRVRTRPHPRTNRCGAGRRGGRPRC
jgi:hypothetical protein